MIWRIGRRVDVVDMHLANGVGDGYASDVRRRPIEWCGADVGG